MLRCAATDGEGQGGIPDYPQLCISMLVASDVHYRNFICCCLEHLC